MRTPMSTSPIIFAPPSSFAIWRTCHGTLQLSIFSSLMPAVG